MKETKQHNKSLGKARKNKNDEFYTKLTDIETELSNYWNPIKTKINYFKNKIVFCNCDDPEESNFWKYFVLNYDEFDIDGEPSGLGIKKLISTHYSKEGPSYKLEYWKDAEGIPHQEKTILKGNGDFQSDECINILKECDIVCTNPPFSLFDKYVNTLLEYKKKFLIIGPEINATHKNIFKHFKNNNIWFGYNTVKSYKTPDGSEKHFGNHRWYTNLPITLRNEDIELVKRFYNEDGTQNNDYKFYDNYDAIECSRVDSIPKDYFKYIGVPTTFFTKFNPEQFKIIGCSQFAEYGEPVMEKIRTDSERQTTPFIDGEGKFIRVFIRRKYKDDEKTILNTDCDYLENINNNKEGEE